MIKENIIYLNGAGQTVYFNKDGVYLNASDIRDFSWSAKKVESKIVSLSRDTKDRTLPVRIACATEEDAVELKNRIFEIFDYDVVNKTYGKLIVDGSVEEGIVKGGYYLNCFITTSKKAKYNAIKRYLELSLTVSTDMPYWICEEVKNFTFNEQEIGGFDYPYNFEFDYGLDNSSFASLNNKSFSKCDCIIRISGYASNPSIKIGNNTYKVNELNVLDGETLIINTKEKTIVKLSEYGNETNCFAKRDREHYAFNKVDVGNNDVSWNGSYKFSVTLIEERSEPKWT